MATHNFVKVSENTWSNNDGVTKYKNVSMRGQKGLVKEEKNIYVCMHTASPTYV